MSGTRGSVGVSLTTANTWSAAQTISAAGAASTPAFNLTGAWFTGGTATTTKPHVLIEPTGATSANWSTSGTGLGVNGASGFAGNLLDLQLNGAARFKVDSTGSMTAVAAVIAGNSFFSNNNVTLVGTSNVGGNTVRLDGGGVIVAASAGKIGFTSGATSHNSSQDTFIVRKAAASTQFGDTDAAAPVAQTLSVQGVVAGTTDTAGAAWTFGGSQGTGTGVGGSIIFAVSPAASTASTQNARVTALTITGNKNIVVGSAALATNATDGFLYIPTCAGTPTGVPTAFTGRVPIIYDTSNDQFWIYDNAAWLQPKTPAAAALITWQ